MTAAGLVECDHARGSGADIGDDFTSDRGADYHSYAKQRSGPRFWPVWTRYRKTSDVLDMAERYHQGLPKGGVTPEFSRQAAVALYVHTLVDTLRWPEETLSICLSHDVREDRDVGDAESRLRFGDRVADAVDAVTKVFYRNCPAT